MQKYSEDLLHISYEDKDKITSEYITLKTKHGQSAPLKVKFSHKIKPNTMYVTFHHSNSKINALFGDESDELIMTAKFKSIKVEIYNV